ncbi:MAG: hypothetical protein K8S97_16290 [Anaerolineae bacterium]|nr:hypothetical protein [Anaerolineae bacterium]
MLRTTVQPQNDTSGIAHKLLEAPAARTTRITSIGARWHDWVFYGLVLALTLSAFYVLVIVVGVR